MREQRTRQTHNRSSRTLSGGWGVLLLVFFAMVDIAASLFPVHQCGENLIGLVPSQVVKKKTRPSPELKPRVGKFEYKKKSSVVPTTSILRASVNFAESSFNGNSSMAASTTESEPPRTTPSFKRHSVDRDPGQAKPYRRKGRRRRSRNNRGKSPEARVGNLPDLEWRAIPMDHLREHPSFIPLPRTRAIARLNSLEDVRQFRQDSWQWDALHAGRCTTSQTVAALGFLEPKAGKILGVPQSWWRGGYGAYDRLRQDALRSLDEMNSVLCSDYDGNATTEESDNTETHENKYWVKSRDQSNHFVAEYTIKVSDQEKKRRRNFSKKLVMSPGLGNSIRMMWGNTQEATSLLTALNYFARNDSGVVLREVGMCGAGLQQNFTTNSNLLIGASPDGLLCHPNGDIEVLEVKNHCPYSAQRRIQLRSKHERFRVRDFVFHSKGVQTQYVPQLMMEMLCVGENCRSAIMVRQTATNGARILRIKRDDRWIEEMLYWLHRFQTEFVESGDSPPPNFFFHNHPQKDRYKRFLEWTKQLETNVELLVHLPNHEIQRADGTRQGNTPFFLD